MTWMVKMSIEKNVLKTQYLGLKTKKEKPLKIKVYVRNWIVQI